MTKTDFDKFVTRQKAQSTGASKVDAKAMRKEWLSHIEALYKHVETILEEYVSRGDIEVSYEPLEINEEFLGSYKTRRMTLKIGSQVVQLVPVGAVIIGARGRVDLVGSRGREKLVLVGKTRQKPTIRITVRDEGGRHQEPAESPPETELGWKFSTPPPSINYIELTSETLMDAIMGVANA